MIELFKLTHLPISQRIRKIIKIFELLETECIAGKELSCDVFYLEGLCRHLIDMYPDNTVIIRAINIAVGDGAFADDNRETIRYICNTLRHELYRQSGVLPSEWDLIAPGRQYGMNVPEYNPLHTVPPMQRPFHAGMFVYAEDIRAPFNLGSIFRTAEAFGTEKLLLSAGCVSPDHSRAQRSAMGCTHFLPWDYSSLEALPAGFPIFALETGGTPITLFQFPRQGVVLIGSEELGLSTDALNRASAGIVSIPMKGIKASLNVAVAFGIVMQYWAAAISG